jgi:hypothetical protein
MLKKLERERVERLIYSENAFGCRIIKDQGSLGSYPPLTSRNGLNA